MTDEVEPLWGIAEVATYLNIPQRTLYQWRHRGYGPPGKRVGRYVRYDPAEVRGWLAALETTPPAPG